MHCMCDHLDRPLQLLFKNRPSVLRLRVSYQLETVGRRSLFHLFHSLSLSFSSNMSDSQTPTPQGQHTPSPPTRPVQHHTASSDTMSPSITTKSMLVDGQSSWNYLTLAGAYVPYLLPQTSESLTIPTLCSVGWCSSAHLGTHHFHSGSIIAIRTSSLISVSL